MKHQFLRDLSKFFAGLVLADFLTGLWLYSSNMLPISFMGINFSSTTITPWLIFDAAVFVILVHYGWHLGKTPTLRTRTYFMLVGIILGIVALAHVLRLFSSADVVVIGWTVPLWLSWIGVVVAAYLSYMSFRLAMSMKK